TQPTWPGSWHSGWRTGHRPSPSPFSEGGPVPCRVRFAAGAAAAPRAPPNAQCAPPGAVRFNWAVAKLADVDLSLKMSRVESEREIVALQRRLLHLRLLAGGQISDGRLGPALSIVFEGWDAAGKGGAIKRLVAGLDPRHVRVQSYAAPTEREKRHHFLWRFWPNLPGAGGMAVFDRSWYGRVLVERVEGFATRA